MIETDQDKPIFRPAGYAALIERYNLEAITNWHTSVVTTRGLTGSTRWQVPLRRCIRPTTGPGTVWAINLNSRLNVTE